MQLRLAHSSPVLPLPALQSVLGGALAHVGKEADAERAADCAAACRRLLDSARVGGVPVDATAFNALLSVMAAARGKARARVDGLGAELGPALELAGQWFRETSHKLV